MKLTTLARVLVHLEAGKQAIGASSTTAYVQDLITTYSEVFEKYMGRVTLSGATTQQFDVDSGDRVFAMSAYPVSEVSSVYNDTDRTWTSGAISSDNYYMDGDGVLTVEYALVAGPGVLRVQYTGGMASTTTAFVAAYPDIAGACDEQVAYHFQRREGIGAQGLSVGSANVSWSAAVDLLPKVKKTLDKHRRYTIA